MEEKLANYLQVPLQVTSMLDEVLGEKVILLLEQEYANWKDKCQKINKYWLPKQVLVVPTLPKTGNMKPDRIKAKALAEQMLSNKCL